MAAAGAMVEGIFYAAGEIPSDRPAQIVHTGFEWNYTTGLNIFFLAVFGVLLWLHRNRERFGGGRGYATDPVCGMQVQTASAPARATFGGREYHFCSEHCRDRFRRDPLDHLGNATGMPVGATDHEPAT
jgi:YHS domain-containing protein